MHLMSSERSEYLALRHDTAERCHKNVSLRITVNMILGQKYRKQNIYYTMSYRWVLLSSIRNLFFVLIESSSCKLI